MKRIIEVLTIAALMALLYFEVIAPRMQPPVITDGPTQPAPVVIQPTAGAYSVQVIELPTQPATEASRAGWDAPTQTGNTGSHNPGRTDKRNP